MTPLQLLPAGELDRGQSKRWHDMPFWASVPLGVVLVVAVAMIGFELLREERSTGVLIAALVVAVVMAVLLFNALRGRDMAAIKAGAGDLVHWEVKYVQERETLQRELPQRKLDSETVERRRQEVQSHLTATERSLPGADAPDYDLIRSGGAADLLIRPSANPTTPMYLLDKSYRVVDWNEAFSLAFDHTLEGRMGESILEWTYFLDNFEEVLDHGTRVFSDPENLPNIDKEPVQYTSQRYGELEAMKRAYQIPDDVGACMAWLVTFELKFADPTQSRRYHYDLIRFLGMEQLWSEYSISYDHVLCNASVYRELLDTIVGDIGKPERIASDARVLDLGAGTGNLALKLMDGDSRRLVVALEKNRSMLDLLQAKCHPHVRSNDDGPGIIVRRQDITSLHGLQPNYFDCAILNNVLYAVDDTESCLRAIWRVLKPGGELRLSGPRKDSRVDVLFRRIQRDLERAGKFAQLQEHFGLVYAINKYRLRPVLHRWSTDEMVKVLEDKGRFHVMVKDDSLYEGQSMLVCATKNGRQ